MNLRVLAGLELHSFLFDNFQKEALQLCPLKNVVFSIFFGTQIPPLVTGGWKVGFWRKG